MSFVKMWNATIGAEELANILAIKRCQWTKIWKIIKRSRSSLNGRISAPMGVKLLNITRPPSSSSPQGWMGDTLYATGQIFHEFIPGWIIGMRSWFIWASRSALDLRPCFVAMCFVTAQSSRSLSLILILLESYQMGMYAWTHYHKFPLSRVSLQARTAY